MRKCLLSERIALKLAAATPADEWKECCLFFLLVETRRHWSNTVVWFLWSRFSEHLYGCFVYRFESVVQLRREFLILFCGVCVETWRDKCDHVHDYRRLMFGSHWIKQLTRGSGCCHGNRQQPDKTKCSRIRKDWKHGQVPAACLLHRSGGILWTPYLDDTISCILGAGVRLFPCGNLQMQIKDVSCLVQTRNLASQVRCGSLDPSGIW